MLDIVYTESGNKIRMSCRNVGPKKVGCTSLNLTLYRGMILYMKEM